MDKQEILKGRDIDERIIELVFRDKQIKYSSGKYFGPEVYVDRLEKTVTIVNISGDDRNGITRGWYYESEEKSPIIREKIRCNFIDGNLDGPYIEWYQDGELKERCTYKNGKLDETFEAWYPNGQLKERKYYIDCKLNGLHEKWYDDGQDKSRKSYVMGKLQ